MKLPLSAANRDRSLGKMARPRLGVRDRTKDAVLKLVRKYQVDESDFEVAGLSESGIATGGFLNPLRTPYSPELMKKVALSNNTLLQCISALVTNCALVGHTLNFIGEESEKESPLSKAFFDHAEGLISTPDGVHTLREIKERFFLDQFVFGYSFIEVGRDINKEILWYRHRSAYNTYLCGYDPAYVTTNRPVYRRGLLTDIVSKERFRRFVKVNGTSKTYYKQFGDPRTIDPKTGKINESLSDKDAATEILHVPNIALSTYGNVDWENNLPALLGSREAEIVNLEYFRDGGMPSLVVMVSGGMLTDVAASDIDEKFNTGMAKDKVHKALILEAKGDSDLSPGLDGTIPAPKITIQELGKGGTDELFQNYDANCKKKVQGSMRLPAIFLGESDSYNYATARASLETTENQVFGPKRNKFDELMNHKILALDGLPSKLWQFVSNGVKVSDPEGVVNAVNALVTAGTISANDGAKIYNKLFGDSIQPREEEWANLPIKLVELLLNLEKAEEMVGKEAVDSVNKLKESFGGPKAPAPTPKKIIPIGGRRPALAAAKK